MVLLWFHGVLLKYLHWFHSSNLKFSRYLEDQVYQSQDHSLSVFRWKDCRCKWCMCNCALRRYLYIRHHQWRCYLQFTYVLYCRWALAAYYLWVLKFAWSESEVETSQDILKMLAASLWEEEWPGKSLEASRFCSAGASFPISLVSARGPFSNW